MTDSPLVSVILPTCGRPHLLPRAVASVFAQTHQAFELIVIDDNNLTARPQTLSALAPWWGDTRLRYVANPSSRNSATARNHGMESACGEWVTFLDDDDAYTPRKIELQLALARFHAAPLVLCGLRYHAARRTRLRQCDMDKFADDEILLRAQGATPALFLRRTELRFDPSCDAAEDGEFFLRVVAHGKLRQVPCVPLPLIEVYQQPAATRVNSLSAALLRGQRTCWFRHCGSYSRAARRLFTARLWWMREISGCGWGGALRAARAVIGAGGVREWRLLLNLGLRRVPLVADWLSS